MIKQLKVCLYMCMHICKLNNWIVCILTLNFAIIVFKESLSVN